MNPTTPYRSKEPPTFKNNLRTLDIVMHGDRKAVVWGQPRESSTQVQVMYPGCKAPRYVPVVDVRLIVDGKPEDVPPIDGVPPSP